MKDYTIVFTKMISTKIASREIAINALKALVQTAVTEGWRPLDGITVAQSGSETFLMQALVKFDETR